MIYEELTGNGELLLLIDDDLNMRALAEQLFELYRYELLTARDCEEGIKKYLEHKVALVLLDIVMPGKTGYDCMHQLKKLDPDVKVIGWSGYLKDTVLLSMGAKAFFKKPVAFRPLLEAVKKVLKGDLSLP